MHGDSICQALLDEEAPWWPCVALPSCYLSSSPCGRSQLWHAPLRLQVRAAHQGFWGEGLVGVAVGLRHAQRHAVPGAVASGWIVYRGDIC